ncbi:unnamed protein product, partial [Rotaria magnacalcarata]
MKSIIVEQGGVLFLLQVIQTFADKDRAIVQQAGEALSRLNTDVPNDSLTNNQIPGRTETDKKLQKKSSSAA